MQHILSSLLVSSLLGTWPNLELLWENCLVKQQSKVIVHHMITMEYISGWMAWLMCEQSQQDRRWNIAVSGGRDCRTTTPTNHQTWSHVQLHLWTYAAGNPTPLQSNCQICYCSEFVSTCEVIASWLTWMKQFAPTWPRRLDVLTMLTSDHYILVMDILRLTSA